MSLVDRSDGPCAVVEVDAAAACPRCAAGKGCGAGLLQPGGARRVEVTVPAGLTPAVDDVVEVSMAPRSLLQAALIVYGLPLAGALAGAAVAYALALGDSAAAVAALLGVGAGLVAGRWRLRRTACLQRFTPSIERLC